MAAIRFTSCSLLALFLLAHISTSNGLLRDLNNELLNAISEDSSQSIETVKELISLGADVSVLTDGGESALHLSCIWNSPEKVSMLLQAGADPNFRSSSTLKSLDMTPLTWCTYGNYLNSVMEFLNDPRTEVNAVVRQENGDFITALDIAEKIKSTAIAQLLKSSGGFTYKELVEKYGERGEQILKLLPNLLHHDNNGDDDEQKTEL